MTPIGILKSDIHNYGIPMNTYELIYTIDSLDEKEYDEFLYLLSLLRAAKEYKAKTHYTDRIYDLLDSAYYE